MLWRPRVDGWAQGRSCRATHFVEHETRLERDVKSLNAPCRLLGNAVAKAAFVESVPFIAARLQATGGQAASGV